MYPIYNGREEMDFRIFLHGHKELIVSHFTERSRSNVETILNPDKLSFLCPPIPIYRALPCNK